MKIGIDIGGSHIAIGVVNENGKILDKMEKSLTSTEKQNIELTIENTILQNVKQFRQKYDITQLGIGMPRLGRKWSCC